MQYITAATRRVLWAILAAGGTVDVRFDIDGTMAPIDLANPSNVRINKKAKAALRRLSLHPQVNAGVLTGRNILDAQNLVGVPGIEYTVNHGLGSTRKYLATRDDVIFVPEAVQFKKKTRQLLERARQALPRSVFFEDKTISLALNVGGVGDSTAQAQIVAQIERELRAFAESLGFRWTHDLTTVEFLPNIPGRNKGAALLDTVHGSGAQFVVFFGDTRTDLSALEAVRQLHKEGINGIGGVVRRHDTPQELLDAASLWVTGVPGVADFMTEFADVVGA